MCKFIKSIKNIKRKADSKYGALSHFAQFCLVGFSGMLVDLASYHTLSKTMTIWWSRAIAIFIAMNWNFAINRRVTFSYSRHESSLHQYFKFMAACTIGNLISYGISMWLYHLACFSESLDYCANKWLPFINKYNEQGEVLRLSAAFVGIMVGTVCNFLTSLLWVFRTKNDNEDDNVQN